MAGQVFNSTPAADTMVGGAGDDTFFPGREADVMTGNGGADTFIYQQLPFAAGEITDFTPGVDILDLTAFDHGDMLADGVLSFVDNGSGGTKVIVDDDGPSGPDIPIFVTTLDNVSAAQMRALFSANVPPVIKLIASPVASESALPNGTSPSGNGATVASFATFEAANGFGDITVGGLTVVKAGVFQGGAMDVLGGTLTFTGFNAKTGTLSYTYAITAPATHGVTETDDTQVHQDLPVTITDRDGQAAQGSLHVGIADDKPALQSDFAATTFGSTAPATGNVLANDKMGADGGHIVGLAGEGKTGGLDTTPAADGSFKANGLFGTLTLQANGDFSYVQNAGAENEGEDVFTYTVRDGDGDLATTQVSVFINDPANTPGAPAFFSTTALAVSESSLPGGSAPSTAALTSSMNFRVIPHDTDPGSALANLSVDGHAVLTNGTFTPTTFTNERGDTVSVTAFDAAHDQFTVSYTLNSALSHQQIARLDGEPDETVGIRYSDVRGDQGFGGLPVFIRDDSPTAARDEIHVPAGSTAAVTGNLLTEAVKGDADGGLHIMSLVGPSGAFVDKTDSAGNMVLHGADGVLTIKPDGSYSYAPSASCRSYEGCSPGIGLREWGCEAPTSNRETPDERP